MKNVLIGGIGNVLLGDDGIGPYCLGMLEAAYEFEAGVEMVDLGTPALDLVDNISGRDAIIFIDSVTTGAAAGTVTLFHKADIVRQGASPRMNTHSPALVDTLLGAEFLGVCPTNVLLVGIEAESFDAGCALSPLVGASVTRVLDEVLRELDRLGVEYRLRSNPQATAIWWESEVPASASV